VAAVEDAFARACEAGDVKGVLALYTEDTVAVWPGAGMEAKGRPELEPLVAGFCRRGAERKLLRKSLEVIPLGAEHAVAIGHWEDSIVRPNGTRITAEVRTTEVLVKKAGAWCFLVDHASIGVPRPRPGARRERRSR
jgi:uncharacterized protein (TIGR02246 family)